MRSVDQACPGTGLCSACASAGASASAKCLKVFLPMQFFCHCHRFVGGVSLLPAAAAVCAARCTLPAFRRSARVALLAAASLLLLLLLRVVCCCLIFYKIGMKSAFPLRYVFTFLLRASFFSLFSLFLAFYLF